MPRLTDGCRRRPPLYGPIALDLAFRIDKTLQNGIASVLLFVLLHDYADGLQDFLDRLMEFGLCGILSDDLFNDLINVRHAVTLRIEL